MATLGQEWESKRNWTSPAEAVGPYPISQILWRSCTECVRTCTERVRTYVAIHENIERVVWNVWERITFHQSLSLYVGNVYGTYTGRIGTYNNSQEYREGCTERIGTYNFP